MQIKQLIISSLCGLSLIACSTSNAPITASKMSCSDAHKQVKANGLKIKKAFKDNDANAIGTLELQNHAIVDANLKCFPKLAEKIKYWKKLNNEM